MLRKTTDLNTKVQQNNFLYKENLTYFCYKKLSIFLEYHPPH